MKPSIPKIVETIAEIRDLVGAANSEVALVPTMGALHVGHLELARKARERVGDSGVVITSIFVNPTQFGPGEDFATYPRDLARDVELCGEVGVDIVFAPEADDVYFSDASIDVQENSLSQLLCGASRPGHFAGVCLVVLKLFNMVQPHVAVFGKKDYQQLAIIRRMVRDLNLPVELVGVDTVREPDGLAMSSRNAYLSEVERPQAAAIRRALLGVQSAFNDGETRDEPLREVARLILNREAPLGRIDYLEIVDAETMKRVSSIERPALAAVAVFFGKCRLIDNIELLASGSSQEESKTS